MRAVLVVMVGLSSIAAADDREIAVRAGVSWFATDGTEGSQAGGAAPYVDGELGTRSDHVTYSVSGSLFSLRSTWSWSDQDVWIDTGARYVLFDLGGRVTVHGSARQTPFWGVGLAVESVYETGHSRTLQCQNPICDPRTGPGFQSFTRWHEGPLFEMHAGFDFETSIGAVDVIAIAGFGGDPDPVPYGDSWMTTLRLAAGMRF